MNDNSKLENALYSYLNKLNEKGAISPKVIQSAEEKDILILQDIPEISLPKDLITYFKIVGGYDNEKCYELDIDDPEFAWGMHLIPLEHVESHYDDSAGCGGEENPDYWPLGFLPILATGGGSYVVVNCLADSLTYGAVYDMSEGVGCNLISRSIIDFITGNTEELDRGIRVFKDNESSDIPNFKNYLSDCSSIYGNTPYFSRVGRMGDQIVDWY